MESLQGAIPREAAGGASTLLQMPRTRAFGGSVHCGGGGHWLLPLRRRGPPHARLQGHPEVPRMQSGGRKSHQPFGWGARLRWCCGASAIDVSARWTGRKSPRRRRRPRKRPRKSWRQTIERTTTPLSFLQINLGRCRMAQDLLWQTVAAKQIGLAIVSEPYDVKGVQGWHLDRTGWAAIGVCPDCSMTPRQVEAGEGYVAVDFPEFTLYSCYFSPNKPLSEFESYLARIEESLSRRQGVKCIVAGDFNAKSEEWHSGRTDHKGTALGECIAARGLHVVNVGATPTRAAQGYVSVIDVTFATEALLRRISDWTVLDEESGSDHRYIYFQLHREVEVVASKKLGRWAVKKLSKDKLQASYLALTWGREEEEEVELEEAVRRSTKLVTKACDSSMPRCGPPKRRRAVYWWTDEIAQLRAESNRRRRIYQRSRGREEAQAVAEQYQQARKRLKAGIRGSKKAAWTELCNMVDDDPFGKPYKVLMKRLGGPSATSKMEPATVEQVIDDLFPRHPRLVVTLPQEEDGDEVVPFSTEEVDAAVERLHGKMWKAPGPDQIPNPVWTALHAVDSSLLVDLFNQALREGQYASKWKKARLALIPKGGKPPGHASSYRPLCLLDTDGKLLERAIVTRLEDHLERRKFISDRQYGFRAGRSTADATTKLKQVASRAWQKRQFCVAVSIDIRNAFNTMWWKKILQELSNARVPVYLLKIISSYLSSRTIEAETSAGTVRREVTSGVPQGSVLGPTLWNVAFNGIFKVKLPPGVQLICYADDTLVVGVADTVDEVENRVNRALDDVTRWIESAGLTVAAEKTEAILFTKRRKYREPTFRLGGVVIGRCTALKYLGLWFDKNLDFRHHFEKVTEKATRIVGRLSALMSNLGGPTEIRRRMLMDVAMSVLLYGAPVWADSLRIEYRRKAMERVQRRAALRCVSAYRTVSTDALCVLARTPPVRLLAEERAEVFEKKKKKPNMSDREVERVKQAARRALLVKWKDYLSSSATGGWTRTLIRDLDGWMNRGHGQMNFHLTQLMSGHGCFNDYLFRMGKVAAPSCSHCTRGRNDGPQHTLFECEAWRQDRCELVRSLEEIGVKKKLAPETLVPIMLSSSTAWNRVSAFACVVMKKKMEFEWARQRQAANDRADETR